MLQGIDSNGGGNEELLRKIEELESIKSDLERKVESKTQSQDAEYAVTLKVRSELDTHHFKIIKLYCRFNRVLCSGFFRPGS